MVFFSLPNTLMHLVQFSPFQHLDTVTIYNPVILFQPEEDVLALESVFFSIFHPRVISGSFALPLGRALGINIAALCFLDRQFAIFFIFFFTALKSISRRVRLIAMTSLSNSVLALVNPST